MKAVGFRQPGPIAAPDSLLDLDLPAPVPGPHDLLVEVRAISVNPVDTKVRMGGRGPVDGHRILGWDAAGVVAGMGAEVKGFARGDEVFYAGDLNRPGANAELHLVDARIAARKPKSLGWSEAAALPLTAITAWETLFDRIDIRRPVPGAANALLILGGAGGVGSMAIQMARRLTDVTVIATASRPESRQWALDLGAHHVVDHAGPLPEQVAALGLGAPAFVFSTTHTDQHLTAVAEIIAPQGRFALIDDPASLDVVPFKRKSVSIHWELMFTRSLFQTPDMAEQGRLLAEVARLVDAGTLRSTLAREGGTINAANLRAAHALLESHASIGKLVLAGFDGGAKTPAG